MEKHVELSCLLDQYGAMLTERQRMLMEQHISEDYSLAEIAEREGISRQGVRDALKRGEEQLYELESKLHLMERNGLMRAKVQELMALAEALGAENPAGQALRNKLNELNDMIGEW